MGDRVIAIPQPSHAWLSGQAMRAWGNERFGLVAPFEDVCLGAEQHDLGWLTWEQTPTLNPATGRPHSFRELDVGQHTGIWRLGSEMAQSLGRYPALLVSLHGSNLYRDFDLAAADPSTAAVVRGFLEGQAALQERLIASLQADQQYERSASPETLLRNRMLVSAVDRLSIAICTGLRDIAVRSKTPGEALVRDVPTAQGTADLRIRTIEGDPARFTISPWPFAAASLTVACEGLELPRQRFSDQRAMLAALRSAPCVSITAELTPDDRPPA
jgi:Protein of unknown function (DUF3891)